MIPPINWSLQFAMWAEASEWNSYWWMPTAGKTFTIMMGWRWIIVLLWLQLIATLFRNDCSMWFLFAFHVYHTHWQLEWSAIDFNAIKISLRSHCLLRVDTLDFRCFVKICMQNLSSIIVCILVTVLQW